MSNSAENFDHIAPIEMHAIYRALQEFGPFIKGRAVLLFVDNTHAIGCLLKRSATIRERGRKRTRTGDVVNPDENPSSDKLHPYSHFQKFCELSIGLRRTMNEQARAIWQLITKLDLVIWIEYVKTECNIADPPSRMKPLPIPSRHISAAYELFNEDSDSSSHEAFD